MMAASHIGSLELRESRGGAVRFRGTFPYNTLTTLRDGGRNGGRPLKERIMPGAFSYAIEDEQRDILFLSGHRFDKPMASKKAGTLQFEDTDTELRIMATITPDAQETSWVRDFLSAYRAGLVLGLSPGFRVPPQQTVPGAEKVEEEDPSLGRALIRSVFAAVLFEISAVTKGQYEEATLEEARALNMNLAHNSQPRPAAYRWR